MEPELVEVEERIFALLCIRLDRLVSRRVPVRGVSAGPVHRTSRLMFADGTTLIVRSECPGGVARVLHATLKGHAVLLEEWTDGTAGLQLSLALPSLGRQRHHRMVVLGADQPD